MKLSKMNVARDSTCDAFMTKYLIFCVSWYHTDEFCLLSPASNHPFCPDFVNLYVKLVLHHGSSKVK